MEPTNNNSSTSDNTVGQNTATQSTPHDAGKNTAMAVIAYIGPLVIVSYLVAKDDPFVKFHIKQGLVLFVIEIAVWFLGMIISPLLVLSKIVNFATFILAIVGIVNVVKGRETPLPLVGKYSQYLKF